MKERTNEESLDPMPGELPVTASRSGAASAQHEGKNGAAPVDPDALFEQVLDGANQIWIRLHYGYQPKPKGKGKLVT